MLGSSSKYISSLRRCTLAPKFQDMYSSMYRAIDMLHMQDPNSCCGYSDSKNGLWKHEMVLWDEGKRWMSNKTQNMGLIKRLREQTGAPISDVKSALEQADWDLETATQELRKKGLAAASKKSSRHAAEGLVGIAKKPTGVSVIEINSETDFVARNEMFQNLIGKAASAVLQSLYDAKPSDRLSVISGEALDGLQLDDGQKLHECVADVAGVVRENIKLRRAYYLNIPEGSGGCIGSYVHAGVAHNIGRIASLVLLEYANDTGGKQAELEDLAHKLALHVAGASPQYLDRKSVSPHSLEKERKVLEEQASQTGKSPEIISKMVDGRLGKFYESVCLLEQPFIMDDKQKVEKVVDSFGKEAGFKNLRISAFLRCQVGEGLEQTQEKDFAEQVRETIDATAS